MYTHVCIYIYIYIYMCVHLYLLYLYILHHLRLPPRAPGALHVVGALGPLE